MKTSRIITLTVLSGLLLSAACKKHVIKPVDQLSLLPPATQTGANTFGCLVNGQAFVPGGSVFSGAHFQCNYIYTANGFHLTVAADNENDNNTQLKGVIVGTDSLAIVQGQTLVFKTFAPGNADASYTIYPTIGQIRYVTNNTVSGELTITKLDSVKQIVSGTFYFNAINIAGETVSVTDGRFDMQYTR